MKMGRPTKPIAKKRTELVATLLTPVEKRKVLRLAKKNRLRVSSFIRELIVANL